MYTKLILAMILISTKTFGQTVVNELKEIKKDNITETYLDPVINVVNTNLNYGKSNDALAGYKKGVWGAMAGVSFQAGITPRFSLVTELYFIMKGGGLKDNNPLTAKASTFRFYTFELPVLARFHLGKFYGNAGPSLGYNFYGTEKIDGSTKDISFNNSNQGFKHFDAGIQIGAGYRFKVKQKQIALDVRYAYGLTNISNNMEMYNRNLIINIRFSSPWKTNPFEKN